jgi:hypothetical protein
LLWIGCVALNKYEFIAVPSAKELDAFFHYGGRFQEAHNNKKISPLKPNIELCKYWHSFKVMRLKNCNRAH